MLGARRLTERFELECAKSLRGVRVVRRSEVAWSVVLCDAFDLLMVSPGRNALRQRALVVPR
jgi:hypothetical protein